mgnify:CR=1 FL=1
MNPPAPTEIPKQPAELAEQLAQYNSDIAALQLMVDGEVEVVDYTSDEQHNYTLELSDGKIVNAALQAETDTDIPAFAINADGYWEYQLGGEKQTLTDLSGNPVPARKSLGKGTVYPSTGLRGRRLLADVSERSALEKTVGHSGSFTGREKRRPAILCLNPSRKMKMEHCHWLYLEVKWFFQ